MMTKQRKDVEKSEDRYRLLLLLYFFSSSVQIVTYLFLCGSENKNVGVVAATGEK